MSRRRLLAVASALALVAGLVLPATTPTAQAADRTVALVGSLQTELGCPEDWQPDCAATNLARDEGGSTYRAVFQVPAGTFEYKVALNDGWDESYGPDGSATNGPLVLEEATRVLVVYDDMSHTTTLTPTDLDDSVTDADKAMAQNSLRSDLSRERFYFVLPDRFANGSTGNDAGGLAGDRLTTGFDPSDKGFYHGGDLKGLTGKLDYIKGLGTTAIWLTPSFKNRPVQGTGTNASAGYHGYWITDFTQIDPHLGTNKDMLRLIDRAHKLGMKVFFDIITNHTADVIGYADAGERAYRSKADFPYKDADGNAFDDRNYLTRPFPSLSPDRSFPYPPVFATSADASVKVPAWLNDRTLYHNRGETTYAGENSTYGDFAGLDDLFSENMRVVDGMADIYKTWVNSGIDGFRIDTVKHVNLEFWQRFAPAVLQHARDAGNPDFFMFGEVFDGNPGYVSSFTTSGRLQAALDFGFQGAASGFAQGKPATGLRDLYAGDDYYTDTDSNAYSLPTFLGNHDMGRLSMMLTNATFTGDDRLKRLQLANQLMFLTRGQPVTYYGDEQGFVGEGGDKDARQDMFATRTPDYMRGAENYLFDDGSARDRYSTSTPLYRLISELSALRASHPTLADGAQITRFASPEAGIFAVSRFDPREAREYIVAVNNSPQAQTADFDTYSRLMSYTPVYGGARAVSSRADGRVQVTVPGLSAAVWKAAGRTAGSKTIPALYARTPGSGDDFTGRARISAALGGEDFAQVTFAWRPAGTSDWRILGTDDSTPHGVYHDVSAMPKGLLVEYRMIAKDIRDHYAVATTSGIVGTEGISDETGAPPSEASAVSVPGSHNDEMGCAGDWQPDCEAAQLAPDAKDGVWKKSFANIPAGGFEYKVAVNKTWDENYGAGGTRGGANVAYTSPGGPVSFYYDHRTHNFADSTQGPLVVAAGTFQSELGCPQDNDPACMRPWLGDQDGDGVYTWRGAGVPAGSYTFKIAYDLGWDVNYGAGGVRNGPDISITVPASDLELQISYDSTTHIATARTAAAASAVDLTKARAHWVQPGLLAWPARDVPPEEAPGTMRWRLQAASSGGMTVGPERIESDEIFNLTYDRAGLPAAVVAKYPHLKGYLALKFKQYNGRLVKRLLTGQLALGQYTDGYRLRGGTGVQIAPVLDSLYGKARTQTYGVTWNGSRPTFRVWAPTAKSVSLVAWRAGSAADAPASQARRFPLRAQRDGSWAGRPARLRGGWEGARYLYEVKVYQPATGRVEANLVTDPYSVALTLDSTRSVAVDLNRRAYRPALWRRTASPPVPRNVDSTIYELHVRDFSASDAAVPAEHRGSYLAFADQAGNGYRHLQTLAKAGLNTVHLLPTFDIASIPENPAAQQSPNCDLPSYPPDSDRQQACVLAAAAADAFNWGYDPWHWMAPEGSYASSAARADGALRVAEFRTMVGGLHKAGLRVVLDQVYNHTPSSGQAPTSVLDRIVPGYYQRLNASGQVETSTCCQNVATEHAMAEKMMVDSVVLWAKQYKIDGFRFDLMGHHSKANMLAVRKALDGLTRGRDGVDGKTVLLYGEGWNFGEVANNARFEQASQGQLGGTGIGTFSDRLRDAVRGGGPFAPDPRLQGLGTGLVTDPNGVDQPDAAARLATYTDLAQLGLAGNLRSFSFRGASGKVVTGAQVSYNGVPAGYADEPDEVISYVDAHDNETLFDELTYKLPRSTSMNDRVRMNTIALSFTALAQTPLLWHAGTDLLRSKSLDRNSYNSGDWFNRLDWTGQDNGFGHGLPPKPDNEAKWVLQKPLLADAALKPSAEQVQAASAQAQDLLRLRFSTPLFRLGSADLIKQKVTFPVSGTANAHRGVVVMRIDDTVGKDVDRRLQGVVVVFNTTPRQVEQQVPGLVGGYALSPVQAGGADPVVKMSTWESATATLTVPARTVAVFVQS